MDSYISLFRSRLDEYRGRTAVVDRNGSRQTSYEELDFMSRKVAGKLISSGILPGSPVLINLERGREYVAAYLGILTAGCAAVPVTPEYPAERISYIAADCGSAAVIDSRFFSDIENAFTAEPVDTDSSMPSHITYTSGSTGKPKGILHTVDSMYHICCDPMDLYDIGETVRYAAASTFSFFICVYDVLRPLLLGGEVHIVSDAVRKDADLLSAYYLENRINIGFISPQLLKNFRIQSPYLRRILAGGEMLSNRYSDDFEIINVYGTSETGLVSSFKVDRAYRNTPIGRPLPGCILEIKADADNGPDCKEGELIVTGRFAREYINLPENSSLAFEKTADGNTVFHTGDIVRLQDDGNFVYLNRSDWMVKINGQRVETLEIESVINEMPGITNAAVKAFTDDDGQNYLCAYYVSEYDVDDAEIRRVLGEKLPPYMMPRFIVKCGSLKFNASGKLDRVSLQPPSAEDYKTEYSAPSNEREKAVCEAFSDVLRCGDVGVNDDFISLGGDSIKAMKLISSIEEKCGLTVSASEVLSERTPAMISALLRDPDRQHNGNSELSCVPLTDSQRGVYFECAENPESTRYNIPVIIKLPSSVDEEKFAAAVKTAAERHPSLFATVSMTENGPVMVPGENRCEVVYDNAGSIEEYSGRFAVPFDLENGPLYRFTICSAPDGNAFLMDVHHIVFDGTSIDILLGQIADAYEGRDIPCEKESLFGAFDTEKSVKSSTVYAEAAEFFRGELEECEFDTEIISDVPFPDKAEGSDCLSLASPAGISHDVVEEFARKNGITESTLFTAAFSYALSVFRGSPDSCFTTVSSGRHSSGLDNTVGMFVKTLPLHIKVPDNGAVSEYLAYVRDRYYLTLKNDIISFGDLAADYGVNSDISFVYQAELLSPVTIGGVSVTPEQISVNDSQADLLCMMFKTESGYCIRSQFRKRRFSSALIESISNTLFSVVLGMINCVNLQEIQLVNAEQAEYIDYVNQTETAYSPVETVNSLFEKAVRAYPEKNALNYGESHYSFAEVDAITAKIAAYIVSRGFGKDDFIAVLAPRNDTTVLASWGVIRAGAALQPLDPTYPAERLNYMIGDSGARLLIAERSLAGILEGFSGDILYIDEIPQLPEAAGFTASDCPEGAIALIYSSGTTGKPKGAILENRNLVAFYHNHRSIMGFDENSRVASYASFGFDAGVMDIVTVPLSGSALYIIPDEIRLDLESVDEYYCANGITHGFMTTQVGRMFAEHTKCSTLRAFLVGGEKLVPFTPGDAFRFINGYGPCETMAYICHYEVRDNAAVQPIGKPSGNTKLYVIDKSGRMLPPGGVGELGISGLQVGRGYLGMPEKTAAVFVSNPFTDDPGYERIYKTGDVVRLLTDGNIEYIGRNDSQVKIRGYRVELTEIEEIIRRFEGVTDATVAAFDLPSGGKYIAAYVTGNNPIDIDKLHSFIRSEKPSYMVPSVTMQIDKIPYTQNQKVNRRALPVPERKSDEMVPPENDTQRAILNIISEIIGHDNLGITTEIFDAGLTSIGTLKLNLKLGQEFSVPLKVSDIRDNPTVRQLEAFLEGAGDAAEYSVQADYPLMRNQMGVFLDSGMDRKTVKYNVPLLMKISGKLSLERLAESLCRAIDAHPFMKATLTNAQDGSIRAVRNDDAEPVVDILKVDELPDAEHLIRPFDLMGGRLYRAEIYNAGDNNYLFIDIHHIIGDGTSIGILLDDINAAYSGCDIKKEAFSGFEAALDEERVLSEEKTGVAEKYYEKLLSGCNTECLPAKCPEKGNDAGKPAHFSFSFDEASAAVIEFCGKNRISANAFFNAVFAYTLSEFLHSDDISYCTIYNGRNDSRLERCFDMLVKTLPVRCFVDTAKTPAEFSEAMQKQLIETMSNDIVPFGDLSSEYGIKSELFFNYQGDSFVFDSVGGEEAEMLKLEISEIKAPLSVEVFLDNGVFHADFSYLTDFYCREFISSFAGALATAANDFTAKQQLKEVSVLSAEESENYCLLNDNGRPFEDIPAQAVFERVADELADKTAVISAGGSLSFRELDEKANAVANSLLKLGTSADEMVGLILNRTELVPVAEIGIMKSGAAFLPMLPTYPDDRLEYCMSDAACRYVIATRDIIEDRKDLFENKPYKVLPLEELIEGGGTEKPSVEFSSSQLAYCIYTSGSTGTPKGVMIEQHNLSNFVQTSGLCDTEVKGSAVLCMASISFDMSVTEIFFSLCQGKTVYIAAEEEIHNLDFLLEAFIANNIDLMMMTPSFAWNLLSLKEFEGALSKLKAVVLGAEAFQPALLTKLKALNPDMLVQNGYGPTECTQVCTLKTLDVNGEINIGSPFANTKLYVADINGNILPRYAVGEMLIGGEGVCRGYVNLPEKNASAFTEIDGVRVYHSGDLVRINGCNEVEFGGRSDNQVKLRGFRIELDEIESVMQEYPGITRSQVVVRNNGTEDFLAAYYTSDNDIDNDALTDYMRTKLTYYMIPAAMMRLESMPMTPNGKLDKKALPEIRQEKKARTKRAPKKSLEAKIAELFSSVLNIDECYVDDNFFEIGGTSLSASKVVMQLKADGYKAEYQDIFDHQSPAELADYLESVSKPAEAPDNCGARYELYHQDEKIAELLKYNAMEYAADVVREPLGDVLLTGPTGFLGIHILKALLENESGRIICLMRRGRYDDLITRLKTSLVYYFEDDCDDEFRSRISVIEGDIVDENLGELLKDVHFDTLINCAACVKHYANDNSIEVVNVQGVENLIRIVKEKKAKMIQISTTSVPGAHNDETLRVNLKMAENSLFVIDDMNNQYCRSKYQAELRMLDAIADGMRGKIIRVGNLMGRYVDGEFQTNMRTNAFLNGLRGFVNIGKCPISHCTDPMSFSPVDCSAKAIVLLAGTNDKFTAFHADSRSTFDEMKVMDAMNRCGITVKPVSDEEYYADFYRMMADPEQNSKVSALLTNDRPDLHMVPTENRFTANVLYRLGFSWPFIDDDYLEKVIRSLDTLDFFMDD